jgi:hypothetical protein
MIKLRTNYLKEKNREFDKEKFENMKLTFHKMGT